MDDKKPEEKKKFFTLPKVGVGLGLGTFGWWTFDPETMKSFLTSAWKEELFKMLIAFFFAGLAHRAIFRKDIEKQLMRIVNPVVDALNKIADRTEQTDRRIDRVVDRVTRLESLT